LRRCYSSFCLATLKGKRFLGGSLACKTYAAIFCLIHSHKSYTDCYNDYLSLIFNKLHESLCFPTSHNEGLRFSSGTRSHFVPSFELRHIHGSSVISLWGRNQYFSNTKTSIHQPIRQNCFCVKKCYGFSFTNSFPTQKLFRVIRVNASKQIS
jgi:hypothetical protein